MNDQIAKFQAALAQRQQPTYARNNPGLQYFDYTQSPLNGKAQQAYNTQQVAAAQQQSAQASPAVMPSMWANYGANAAKNWSAPQLMNTGGGNWQGLLGQASPALSRFGISQQAAAPSFSNATGGK